MYSFYISYKNFSLVNLERNTLNAVLMQLQLKNVHCTVNGTLLNNNSIIENNSIINISDNLVGGALTEDDKVLAMLRNNKKVCRKCNARLSINRVHCRKRMCGYSNKLRMKKKRRDQKK